MPKGEYSLSMSVWILLRQGRAFNLEKSTGEKTPRGVGNNGRLRHRRRKQSGGLARGPGRISRFGLKTGMFLPNTPIRTAAGEGAAYIDVWVFPHECGLLQTEEVCGAM